MGVPEYPTDPKICCLGAGYVGGPTMSVIAKMCPEIKVTVCDLNERRIAAWNSANLPIYEPGLEDLVARNVAAGRLHFTTELGPAVAGADAVFIAVGTPTRRGDGHADLSYVFDAARELAELAAEGQHERRERLAAALLAAAARALAARGLVRHLRELGGLGGRVLSARPSSKPKGVGVLLAGRERWSDIVGGARRARGGSPPPTDAGAGSQ